MKGCLSNKPAGAGNWCRTRPARLARPLVTPPPDHSDEGRVHRAVESYALGLSLTRQGRADQAVDAFRQAIACHRDFSEAHAALGALLADGGQFDQAIVKLECVVQLQPASAAAHYNLAVALDRAGQLDRAVASYRSAIALQGDWAQAHNNLGAVLAKQQHRDQAVAAYRAALSIQPDFAEAWYNLGIVLKPESYEEAAECYRRAVAARPDFVEARHNLAITLADQRKFDDAAREYRQIVERQPNHVDAYIGLATTLLHAGQFDLGWPQYEWRIKHPSMPQPPQGCPAWRGEPLNGRTVLLLSEQGAGDTLQFVRYAEMVKQRGGRVLVQCSPALESLLAGCPGVDGVLAAHQPPPPIDAYAWLASLPGIFGTSLNTIPGAAAYLQPRAEIVDRWRARLSGETRFKIGIAWQGNPIHPRDRDRSIPLREFVRLGQLPGVRLFSLQFGAGREQLTTIDEADRPVDFGDELGDFESAAGLIANLDLVVTCDSAPAHLAGAVGANVWVALAYACDWRWLADRTDSLWYPTMRLFRQQRRGDWAEVFSRIADQLDRQPRPS